MPSNREVQARRREAIRQLLITNDPPIEEQKDLVKRLKEMGIPATQSSVSRDLNELGAVRVRGHYQIPSWREGDSPLREVKNLISRVVTAGPHQMLLVTQHGAGGVVAEALEALQLEDVLGTVAGYSSVLILTQNKVFQDVLWLRLKHDLGLDGEEGKQARSGPAPDGPPGESRKVTNLPRRLLRHRVRLQDRPAPRPRCRARRLARSGPSAASHDEGSCAGGAGNNRRRTAAKALQNSRPWPIASSRAT